MQVCACRVLDGAREPCEWMGGLHVAVLSEQHVLLPPVCCAVADPAISSTAREANMALCICSSVEAGCLSLLQFVVAMMQCENVGTGNIEPLNKLFWKVT